MRALPLLLLVSGCLPLPFAVPPAEVSASVGARVAGAAPPPTNWAGVGTDADTVVRAGLYPAGWNPDWMERPIDLGAGYVAEFGPSGAFTHGGYGEFRFHPWVQERYDTNGPGAWRVVLHLTGDVLYSPVVGTGGGGSVGVSFEGASFVDGDVSQANADGGLIAVAYGEVSYAAGLDFSYRYLPGYSWFGLQVRFRFRMPAAAGVLLVPIWEFL